MRKLRFAGLFLAALIASSSAVAGVAGVFETVVYTAPGTNVSYSKTGVEYKAGYTVTISKIGGPTNINSVVFRGTTEILFKDNPPAGATKSQAAVYLEVDGLSPSTCKTIATDQTKSASTFECTLGRFREADPPKVFTAYVKSPPNGTGIAGAAGIEYIKFTGVTGYSEDLNDASGVGNDTTLPSVAPDVTLGTTDPTVVKGAVSSFSGATLSTGPNDGVPSSAPGFYKFATKLNVPPGGPSTFGSISLKAFTLLDNNIEYQLCDAGKNFRTCYESTQTVETVFTAASGKYITIILRVDVTELKPSFSVRKLKVYYTDNGGDYSTPLQKCADQPLSDDPLSPVTHCIDGIEVLGSNAATGLPGDLQVTLRGTRNGRGTIY